MSTAYLAHACVNDALPHVPAGTAALAVFSPRYLDLIDYTAAAAGADRSAWRRGRREPLADYLAEHRATVGLLAEAMTADATICLEIDEYRDLERRALVNLPDCWRAMLEGAGFRIVEHIRLARTLALGHRSGHFVRHGGKPGLFLPDNVCSTLIVAQRGDPMARMRQAARHQPEWAIPLAEARPYLTNLWRVAPPTPRYQRTARGPVTHPVPMDPRVADACLRFYSLPGDHVLAPFSGSGTVGAAALAQGRIPICIEREAGFVDLIRQRLGSGCADLPALPRPVTGVAPQLSLSLGEAAITTATAGYTDRTGRAQATTRQRLIAAHASKLLGVSLTPEMIAGVLMAERDVCALLAS